MILGILPCVWVWAGFVVTLWLLWCCDWFVFMWFRVVCVLWIYGLVSRNFGFVCGVFLWCFGVTSWLAGLKSVGWVIFWWLLCLVWVGVCVFCVA